MKNNWSKVMHASCKFGTHGIFIILCSQRLPTFWSKPKSIFWHWAWKIIVESLNYSTVCRNPYYYLRRGTCFMVSSIASLMHQFLPYWKVMLPSLSLSIHCSFCHFSLWGFIFLVNLHALSSHTRKITYSLVQHKGHLCDLQAEYSFTFIYLCHLYLLNIYSIW